MTNGQQTWEDMFPAEPSPTPELYEKHFGEALGAMSASFAFMAGEAEAAPGVDPKMLFTQGSRNVLVIFSRLLDEYRKLLERP